MIAESILAINPTARFQVVGTIDNIIWYDETTPIAKADIEAKITELQAEHDALQWKRNRQEEYPDAIECVHALLVGGDTLTDLQTKRTTIKEKYPKE